MRPVIGLPKHGKTFGLVIFLLALTVGLVPTAEVQSAEAEHNIDLDGLSDPERQVIQSVLEATMAALETSEVASALTRFGFTNVFIADAISDRLEESFAASANNLGRDLAINYATDIIAESFADIMMNSAYAERLPDRMRNPLRAMLEASVREGFGVAESIVVDGGNVGPFALMFPVLDRVQDAIEIHEAATGTVQARNATLISAALGAELNSDLVTRYPSPESDQVAAQWLEDSRDHLRNITSPQEYQVLVSMLDDGFSALVALRSGECDTACTAAIDRLRSGQSPESPDLIESLLHPTETSLRLLGGYDPTAVFAESILNLTSLETVSNSSTARANQPSSAEGSAPIAVVPESILEDRVQQQRRTEICERYWRNAVLQVSANQILAEINGLTGNARRRAITCLAHNRSFSISSAQLLQLTFGLSQSERQDVLCENRGPLSAGLTAQEFVLILDDLRSYARERVITCLIPKLGDSQLSSSTAMRVLGNLVPEQYEGWDETLADYDAQAHIRSLCVLSNYLADDIGAQDAALLLGQSRNSKRLEGVRCLSEKITHGLTWDDVDTILDQSLTNRGAMIDLLGERTPDGLNTRKLTEFLSRYRLRRYLNDPDPPAWLGGQCIAFARLAYEWVTNRTFDAQFGQASNVISGSTSLGFETEADPQRARVGALVVWENGGAGHVGVVVGVIRNDAGSADRIKIAESNWGTATDAGARRWGLSVEEAQRELVTDRYGYFDTTVLRTSELDRPAPRTQEPLSYRFVGYVLP